MKLSLLDKAALLTVVVPCSLRLAEGVVGMTEVGSDHAGVGPGGCVLSELGQELDATLDEQRAGLLQPHPLAAVAHVTLRMQQEVLYLDV